MSRVGRLPIPLPKDVVVKIENGEVTVKGPKGELRRNLGSDISISQEKNTLVVARANDEQRCSRPSWLNARSGRQYGNRRHQRL